MCSLIHWLLGDLNVIFRQVIFLLIFVIDGYESYKIALMWLSLDLTDDKSTCYFTTILL